MMMQPCANCAGGFVISDVHLTFMLRDELIDYIIASKCDSVYVGLNPSIYASAIESKILHRQLSTVWKNKHIYIYASDGIRREKFVITREKPTDLPANAIDLAEFEN